MTKKTITNNEIGIIGDLHIGNYNNDSIWNDIFVDLSKWIKKEYEERGIRDLVFLGDIFHGTVSKVKEKSLHLNTIKTAYNFFNNLREFNIIMITGNHDCYYKDNSQIHALEIFKDWDNIKVVDSFEEIDGMYFCPWGEEEALLKSKKSKVVFGHFDIKSFAYSKNAISKSGLESKELFKVVDKVFTGHYHDKQFRTYKNKKEINYVGTPLQLNWSEGGKESYVYVYDINKNDIVEEIENKQSPKFINLTINELKKEPSLVKDNFVKLSLLDNPNFEKLEKLKVKLNSLNPKNIEFIFTNQNNFDGDFTIDEIQTNSLEENVKDFINSIDTRIDKDILEKKFFEYYEAV